MTNKIGTPIIAVIWLLFGLALIRYMIKYSWFTTFAGLFTETFTIMLYWTSIIFMTFIILFGIPIYLLVQTFATTDDQI